MKGAKKRSAVVVGCGVLGSYVAGRLGEAGYAVAGVDRDPTALRRLPGKYQDGSVHGDAIEAAVLRAARMERADLVIAATADDNTNLMVGQVARVTYGVAHVLVRVSDPAQEEICRRIGLESICPTTNIGDLFFAAAVRESET